MNPDIQINILDTLGNKALYVTSSKRKLNWEYYFNKHLVFYWKK